MLKLLLYQKIILFVEDVNCIHDLLRKVNATYSPILKNVKWMESAGWLVLHKKGRIIKMELTERGKKVLEACTIIKNEIIQEIINKKR